MHDYATVKAKLYLNDLFVLQGRPSFDFLFSASSCRGILVARLSK